MQGLKKENPWKDQSTFWEELETRVIRVAGLQLWILWDELFVCVRGGDQHAVVDDGRHLRCGTWYRFHRVQGRHALYRRGMDGLLSCPAGPLVGV